MTEIPRICSVFNVLPKEEWTSKRINGKYRITTEGNVEFCLNGQAWEPLVSGYRFNQFIRLINHPDEVELLRHWTSEDVNDAKAVRRVFGDTVKKVCKSSTNFLCIENSSEDSVFMAPNYMFPSLKADEEVDLDQIIGEDGNN